MNYQIVNNNQLLFDCGCSFSIENDQILFCADSHSKNFNIDFNCKETYKSLSNGLTEGVFQLTSSLGSSFTKKLKPETLEHLSGLGSILRPSCLDSRLDDGKSLTEHFVRRKNNEEDVPKIHPVVDNILDKTFGILCVHENSLISLSNGKHIKASQLSVGDKVLSCDLESESVQTDICDGVNPTRYCDGIKIRLNNGWSVTTTKDHQLYTIEGYKEARNLSSDDAIAIIDNIKGENNSTINSELFQCNEESLAYLLGQLTGDGHLSSGSIVISAGSEEKADSIILWLNKNIPSIYHRKYFHLRCWYISLSSDIISIKGCGHRKRKLSYLLDMYNMRIISPLKRIPESIFTCRSEVRLSFIAGLFDSDGYCGINGKNHRVCHICSSSYYLLEDLRLLCSLEGFKTYIDPTHEHLHILNSSYFEEKLINKVIIKKFIGKGGDGVTNGVELRDNLRNFVKNLPNYKSLRKSCLQYGVDRQILQHRAGENRYCRYDFAKKFGLNHKDIIFVKVKNIEKIEDQQFYSISIRKNHNFFANGILLKNCYQEQSMEMVKQCAGFNLQEADILRRGMGHKEPATIAKCKKLFLEKAKTFGVLTEKQAETIFSQIEASQRYAFNLSHSLAYSLTTYITAYIKTHFPIQFYKNWLANEKDRTQYKNFINEAKLFNIHVHVPDIRHLKTDFYNIKNDIYFGLTNIKGILKTDIEKLSKLLSEKDWQATGLGKEIKWINFLYFILDNLSSRTVDGFIKAGALDCFGMDRAVMASEYDKFCLLTDKEKLIFDSKHENLIDLLKDVAAKYKNIYNEKLTKFTSRKSKTPKANQRLAKIDKLISLLEEPVYTIQDTIDSLCFSEEELLGVALTAHSSDSIKVCAETNSCLDIANGYKGYATLRVKIDKANAWKCKGGASAGKYMCFLGFSDGTYNLDNCVAFPAEYAEFKHLLVKDNLVFIAGSLDKDSFIVKRVYPSC